MRTGWAMLGLGKDLEIGGEIQPGEQEALDHLLPLQKVPHAGLAANLLGQVVEEALPLAAIGHLVEPVEALALVGLLLA